MKGSIAGRSIEGREPILSRRSFILAAGALTASSLVPSLQQPRAADKPNSRFNGVQIGVISYSYRSLPCSVEEILRYVAGSGINSVELLGAPVEAFAGPPSSAALDRLKIIRKMYNDAGVNIRIVKFGSIGDSWMSDAQIDYYFAAAKALGAKGITRELSEEAAKRLGPIADRHRIMIGFHNHTQLRPETYDGSILSYGRRLGINLDIGHYVAGTNHSPISLIEKYADRIVSLHLKDRKVSDGPNMPFGQGDTPVALVLQYMKRHQLSFPADIELEYGIPQGSNAVTEVKKCVGFCRQSLA